MGLLFSLGKHRISRRISRKLRGYFTPFHAKDFWGFVWFSGGQTEFPISLGINSYISYQSVTWASGRGKFPNRLRSHVLSVNSDSKNANTCKYGSLICFLSGNSILLGSCRFQIQNSQCTPKTSLLFFDVFSSLALVQRCVKSWHVHIIKIFLQQFCIQFCLNISLRDTGPWPILAVSGKRNSGGKRQNLGYLKGSKGI